MNPRDSQDGQALLALTADREVQFQRPLFYYYPVKWAMLSGCWVDISSILGSNGASEVLDHALATALSALDYS